MSTKVGALASCVAVLALAACDGSNLPAQPDAAPSRDAGSLGDLPCGPGTYATMTECLPIQDSGTSVADLAAPLDLASSDLSSLDLAAPIDLAISLDIAPPLDFSVPLDFATPPDFATPVDFTTPPDLTIPLDFTRPPDLVTPVDLTVPPDLARPDLMTIAPNTPGLHRGRREQAGRQRRGHAARRR